ncbi:MAG TPA: glycosyltransferase family 39 protein [Solirubrobacterales bacterium]|jgi:4-amino-4-deoxy-L-arabinose transferase-like glycosyltransferase|nr:glycosyltransferase family 39 protein [Solirubrobacterales bacterium]
MAKLTAWLRGLPERHGRKTLLLLAAILILGFGLRAYRVVEPLPTPGDDAHAYYALSKSLYAEGSFGGPTFEEPSDWSPGAPLLYAASFYATGGAREGTARIVELLLGLATIVVVYLLGRRIACRPAGLLAAFAVAVYPPFIHSVGALYSEPPAMFTLPAAVLAFLWASDGLGPSRGWRGAGGARTARGLPAGPPAPGQDPRARWLVPGLLFGFTALIRPEYLLVGAAFALLALIGVWHARGWRPGLVGAALFVVALLIPIVPWTIHNEVTLDRTVPISTGGGKALYVGTFLPADGEYQRVKALLLQRYRHRTLPPRSEALEKVDPKPLFNRVAERYPDLPRDSALGKIGKQNFSHYFGEDPLEYLAMTARKTWRMWSAGIGEAMESGAGRVLQVLIVALALAGLGGLAWRRWWWELVAMATPLALVTAVGAISLAAPRRNEVLMTLVFPLAAAALSRGTAALLSGGQWSSKQAFSPPN